MTLKSPTPLDRLVARYGVSIGSMPSLLRNRAWANMQKAIKEESLSGSQLKLLDAATAFWSLSETATGLRISAYAVFAQHVRHINDEASEVWTAGIDRDIDEMIKVNCVLSEFKGEEYFEFFEHTIGINDLSEEEKGLVLANYAVLISAGLEAVGKPFHFLHEKVASDILKETGCNPFGPALGDNEKAEAVAVFKLLAAWPIEEEDERALLGELAAERPQDADRAVSLIREHSPATVGELEALLRKATAAS